MKKTLTTLAICGFIVMNLIADSMDSRTITIGDTIVTAYRDGASGTNRNVFAIRHNDHIILINAGAGGEDGFLRHFIADGNTPEDVTAVLLTSICRDNISGLLDGCATVSEVEGGTICRLPGAVFHNATLYISKSGEKYWDEFPRTMALGAPPPLTYQVTKAYDDRIVTFDFDTEVFSGITAIEAGGLTPGNTIFATRDIMFIGSLSKSHSEMDDGSGALALVEKARKAAQGDEQAKQELIKEMMLEYPISKSKVRTDWIKRLANNTNLEVRATRLLDAKRDRERQEQERRNQLNQ